MGQELPSSNTRLNERDYNFPQHTTYLMPLTTHDSSTGANRGREHNNAPQQTPGLGTEAQAGTANNNEGRGPSNNAGVTINDVQGGVPTSNNGGIDINNIVARTPPTTDEGVPTMTRRPRAMDRWVNKNLTTEVMDMVCAGGIKRMLTQSSQHLSFCNT